MSQGKKGYLALRKRIMVDSVETDDLKNNLKKNIKYHPLDLSISLTKSAYFIMDVVNKSIKIKRIKKKDPPKRNNN